MLLILKVCIIKKCVYIFNTKLKRFANHISKNVTARNAQLSKKFRFYDFVLRKIVNA